MKNVFRKIGKIAISSIALSIGIVIGGVFSVWYLGENTPEVDDSSELKATSVRSEIKPYQPAENAPVGVSVQSVPSELTYGEAAEMTIKTTPGARCTLDVEVNKVKLVDEAFIPQETDEYGMIDWNWTVKDKAPTGKWSLKVQCERNTKSGMVIGYTNVQAN